MANYLRDAIRYQQEMEEANRPVTVNSLMARKAAAIKQNAPAENMLTQYAQTMPQNWQQFGQNMAQAYPTPATGASRDQILGAVTQAAMNAGPLMTVYHGSPHRFDKFDASKIGTGEGAQAYGHGLYFAENPSVGADYQRKLAQPEINIDGRRISLEFNGEKSNPERIAALTLLDNEGNYAATRRKIANDYYTPQKYLDALDELEKGGGKFHRGGHIYTVDLPDEHIAKMLDWDKPVSQQSPEAQKALRAMLDKARKSFPQIDSASDPMAGQVHHLYSQHRGGNSQAVADELRAAGIPGIRYLDQGSRAGGAGTSNFVVFPGNEGLLKILERQ